MKAFNRYVVPLFLASMAFKLKSCTHILCIF